MNDRNTSPVEIERKFLLQELPEGLDQAPREKIRQGYVAITDDGTELRVREEGKQCYLTVKSGAGQSRTELEIPIDSDLFASLWPLTRGRRIRKVRYEIPYGDRTIQVDVYRRKLKGLVTAEVEFPSEQSAKEFSPPDWLVEEITEDDRFKNQNLARYGLREKANV
jgi:adenylate cyclase